MAELSDVLISERIPVCKEIDVSVPDRGWGGGGGWVCMHGY